MNQINKHWRKNDPFSLRIRLTIGIAAVSTFAVGSVAIWTSWKMQQILIESHKENIEKIAQRLPHDVKVYSEMLPVETGVQKAINNRSNDNTFLWVQRDDGSFLAKSPGFNIEDNGTNKRLISLAKMPNSPEIYQINNHYFVLCSNSLQVQGKLQGKLFVVQDITRDQTMFLALVRSSVIACILAIIIIAGVSAFYIQNSLKPLRQISKMTAAISAEDLGQAELYLDNAPREVKELAETFNMMLSRLSQAWEQERQFVSNASHELRTPLTIVHGYLQSILRRQNNLTEIQLEALQTAASETERTIRLLQDLLDLARADGGYLHLKMEDCVLNDLVAEVVLMAERFSDNRIIIEASKDTIKVKADYNRLKQVLLNLMENAVKYSPPFTPVIIKLNQQEEDVIIQVCDQGYGIPLKHQARIFERFYRVDENRSHTTGGTGLGLAIVKTFVESMGGSVEVRSRSISEGVSRLGEGSVFTVKLRK
ncbi:MAG: HAMP domain-containing sensor histidine kinase [Nostocaceae cyanobacterium]|nr:HAMP domain-containing sensor histidine kinase [Nostocaceae cyanobacterium]